MLSAIIRLSIARRGVVLALACALIAYGLYVLAQTGFDIFPEFAPKLVIVQTEAPGLTTEQVEVLVTRPLESTLSGLIGLEHVTSESIAGLSIVTLIFDEHSDIWLNRSQVNERLAAVSAALPAAAGKPVMVPLASSSATVRTLGLELVGGDPRALRDIAEQTVVPRLLALPGVADVNVFGGESRALVVEPRLAALAQHGLALPELAAAVQEATRNFPLGAIESANQQIAIAGAHGPSSREAVADAVVRRTAAGSLSVRDLARVRWGALPRVSAAQIAGRPAVVLMVIGQLGANTLSVSRRIDALLADLSPVLAKRGVTVHGELFVPARYITTVTGAIGTHLLIGGALVLGVLLIGLFDVRTALISGLAIPLSLLAAVIVLTSLGVNLNVFVVGGLAIALGEVVDDAIIDTENIFRRMRLAPPEADLAEIALAASVEVRGSVVYATFVVALVFVPLLTLGGVSGRLFAPLGFAYILAVMASLLVAMTVTPALCVVLLRNARSAAPVAPVFRALNPIYGAAVEFFARRPALAIACSVACALFVLVMLPSFGARFLPDLREGHYIVHTSSLPGTSLDESIRIGTLLTQRFMQIDGVRSVSQWAGRAERGADTYGGHYSEYEIDLYPLSGAGQQRVLEALRAVLRESPGVASEANTFLMERIGETVSGYAAPLVVNLYGNDLDELDRSALALAGLMRDVPGTSNVRVRASHSTPVLEIRPDPARLAALGLSAGDVLRAVRLTYGAEPVGEVQRADRRVPVALLLEPGQRADVRALRALPVASVDGVAVTLAELADVEQSVGRYNILHRNGQRLQTVTAEVSGRDPQRVLADLRDRVLNDFLDSGDVHPEFTGAAVEYAATRRELVVDAFAASFGVLLLIYIAVQRLRHLLIIMVNLPFALAGGVLAVMLGGHILSVGSVVGFVTLFGITVRNSIMLVAHYEHLVRVEGCAWSLETLRRGARERLPAILMTAVVTALAMLPLTIDSDNPGGEIMGPMAAIIVGGLFSSTFLNLLVMPALLLRFGRFDARGPTLAR